jgi:hypothetical protein
VRRPDSCSTPQAETPWRLARDATAAAASSLRLPSRLPGSLRFSTCRRSQTAPLTLKTAPLTLKTAPFTLKTAPLTLKTAPLTLKTAPLTPLTAPLTAPGAGRRERFGLAHPVATGSAAHR